MGSFHATMWHLLTADHITVEAMQAHAEDPGLDEKLVLVHQHPNNVWAL